MRSSLGKPVDQLNPVPTVRSIISKTMVTINYIDTVYHNNTPKYAPKMGLGLS